MNFDSFLSDLIAGVASAAIFSGFAYIIAFLPLRNKVDKFEEKVNELESLLENISGEYHKTLGQSLVSQQESISNSINTINTQIETENRRFKLLTTPSVFEIERHKSYINNLSELKAPLVNEQKELYAVYKEMLVSPKDQ